MKTPRKNAAFTLVEVLVASGILVVVMGMLLTMTDQTQRLVRSTSSKVEQFQDARTAFESMTRRLAQATLNTFWDYQYVNGIPVEYQRSAELRFRSGPIAGLTGGTGPNGNQQVGHGVFFQAPLGMVEDRGQYGVMDHLINTWGYFLEIGNDSTELPVFLAGKIGGRKRYRLMEMMQPSEKLSIYSPTAQVAGSDLWFRPAATAAANRPVRVLTENIVALVILPRLSVADEDQWKKQKGSSNPPILAPDYSYNSTSSNSDPILNPKNQLPPVVQVVMVAIDEPSAQRLQDKYPGDSYLGINYSPEPLSGQNLFTKPDKLDDTAAGLPGDLTRLGNLLTSRKASYRIFATNVSIRGAKWSRNQAN